MTKSNHMSESTLTTELEIQASETKKAALVFRAINHNLRRNIIQLIHLKKRMTVTDIYVTLNLEQPVASQHLSILRKAEIVCTERDGKNIFYSVNYNRIKQLHQKAKDLNEH